MRHLAYAANPLQHRLVELDGFLSIFFPDPEETIHLRAIKAGRGGATLLEMTRHDLPTGLATLDALNRECGLYFCPNAGGHSDAAITRYNACFCEADDLSLAEQHRRLDAAPLPPAVRVETRKSVHAYWPLAEACTEAEWRDLQARLIAWFAGDRHIKNPSRVMRLPFFDYVIKKPEAAGYDYLPVRLVACDPGRRFTVAELQAAFPPAREPGSSGAEEPGSSTSDPLRSWEGLKAELRRRILQDPTARMNREGLMHSRARCHAAKGDSGLLFNPATGRVTCLKGCDLAAILQAFGLPPRPPAPDDPPPAAGLRLVRVSEVAEEAVAFLWHPYLPAGKLSLLDGDPGVGKSWVTCALAAAVTTGRGPLGWRRAAPADVLLLSAEDGVGDTIRPRLRACGADLARVHVVETAVTLDAAGLAALDEALAGLRPALVVIDPLVAYLGAGVDIHRSNQTRAVMARLAELAARHGCAILGVRHLTKGAAEQAIYRGLGSIDFLGAARSALLAGKVRGDARRRALVHIKSNLAELGASFGYELRDGEFFWAGPVAARAEDLLSGGAGADGAEESEAVSFLRAALQDGPRPVREVRDEAKQAGITYDQLRRAKDKLGVTVRPTGSVRRGTRVYEWALPPAPDVPQDSLGNSPSRPQAKPETPPKSNPHQDLFACDGGDEEAQANADAGIRLGGGEEGPQAKQVQSQQQVSPGKGHSVGDSVGGTQAKGGAPASESRSAPVTCDGCGTPGIEHWHQAEAPARAPLYPYLNYSLWLCPVCDDGMRQP